MADTMHVQAELAQGTAFRVTTTGGHTLLLDGKPELGGQNLGPGPMELLLAGIAGCTGINVIAILRKMHQDVQSYQIHVAGMRESKQPHAFVEITLEHHFSGHQLQDKAIARALQLSEEHYCGVSAMLGKAAHIIHTRRITETEPTTPQ